MPQLLKWARATCLALALAAPASAATLQDATSFHVFGDSLSDTGRISDLTFGRVPGRNYWRGRFSDGMVWAEHVAAAFSGRPTSNRAYGGAKAISDRDFAPDLAYQVRRYGDLPRSRRGASPLAAIAIGGNDVMAAVGSPGVRKVGRAAADAVAGSARDLTRRGVESVLLVNLPNLGALPEYAMDSDPVRARRAGAGARIFNNRLDRRIGEMQRAGLAVQLFDAFSLFERIIADPPAFGLTDARTPCLQGNRRCSRAEAATRVFYDGVHPSAATHAIFAEAALADLRGSGPTVLASAISWAPDTAAVAPIPLPAPAAMLVVSLAALGLVRARRRR